MPKTMKQKREKAIDAYSEARSRWSNSYVAAERYSDYSLMKRAEQKVARLTVLIDSTRAALVR